MIGRVFFPSRYGGVHISMIDGIGPNTLATYVSEGGVGLFGFKSTDCDWYDFQLNFHTPFRSKRAIQQCFQGQEALTRHIYHYRCI